MIGRTLRSLDQLLAPVSIRLFGEQPSLLAFLFHVILPEEDVRPSLHMDDGLVITTSGFRRFLDYFLSAGYVFVSPDEVAAGLPPDGRHVLTTFDDGYFNNLLALPALEEFGVPAAFYIATDYVRSGEAYWWDALYRARRIQGWPIEPIQRELAELKALTHDRIRASLRERLGPHALTPHGDHDRPMSPAELRAFAASPWVHVGNHTAHHAILTNYETQGVRVELLGAQDYLEEVTGRRPVSVSYPNGRHSDEVVAVAAACGLSVGITTRQEPNSLPLGPSRKLRLGRFWFDHRTDQPRRLATYRAAHSLRGWSRRLRAAGGVR
jgi:peptidoglycan/xylan/chitin deacetylase (PgdA/CDA1 family)